MRSLEDVIAGLGRPRVVVLGDMVADEYLVGHPSRISREAPVLILALHESFVRPGSAANTAYNLSTLGSRTTVVGVVGDDEPGRRLRAALAERGMDTSGLLTDSHRPTATAMRVVAKGTQDVQQQVVRVDRIETGPVDAAVCGRLIDRALSALEDADALVLSDYEHGVISAEIVDACLPRARELGLTVIVDSHGDLLRFRGVTAATPNQPEAAATVRRELETDRDVDRAGRELLESMQAMGILITRGSQGLALYEHGMPPYHLGVATWEPVQVVDATGAGDTVAAVFTLAVAGGASMRQAAYLANVAGGAVVRRLGAAALTTSELQEALSRITLPRP